MRIMDLKHNMSVIAKGNPLSHADEAERGIIIKSTGISLYYEMTDESVQSYKGDENGNEYLINLIDSLGHIDLCTSEDELRSENGKRASQKYPASRTAPARHNGGQQQTLRRRYARRRASRRT